MLPAGLLPEDRMEIDSRLTGIRRPASWRRASWRRRAGVHGSVLCPHIGREVVPPGEDLPPCWPLRCRRRRRVGIDDHHEGSHRLRALVAGLAGDVVWPSGVASWAPTSHGERETTTEPRTTVIDTSNARRRMTSSFHARRRTRPRSRPVSRQSTPASPVIARCHGA